MADTAVSNTALAFGTPSSDLVGSGTAISTGNTAVITVGSDGGEFGLVLVIEETATAAATLSVLAGDYPPALLSSKGADAIVLAANDLVVYYLEAGRHLQDNGTIRILVTGAVKITPLRLAKGYY